MTLYIDKREPPDYSAIVRTALSQGAFFAVAIFRGTGPRAVQIFDLVSMSAAALAGRAVSARKIPSPRKWRSFFAGRGETMATVRSLRESEATLKLALEASGMRVWKWDPRANRVQYPRLVANVDAPEQVETDMATFLESVHPADRHIVQNHLESAPETRAPFSLQYRILEPNGSFRWISNFGQSQFRDDGSLELVTGLVHNITEQKRAEQDLAESRMRFENLVSSVMEPIICVTPELEIVLFNQSAERAFLIDAGAAIGKSLETFIPAGCHDFYNGWQAGSETAEEARFISGRSESLRAARSDGKDFPFEARVTPIEVAGRKQYAISIRDLSDRLKAESSLKQVEASKRLESMGKMTGGIAHDFNNLLTIISGNHQLIAMRNLDKKVIRYLEEAEKAVALGARLNSSLMSFARTRKLEPTDVDLNIEIHSIAEMIDRVLGETVLVETKLADYPCCAFVDPSEIKSAVLNLAFNAFDAMPNGGRITIETSVVSYAALPCLFEGENVSQNFVRIAVSDTGEGMTEEVRSRAFEPFFTTRDVGNGTGLGLATIHGFVKQSSGRIALSSIPGIGTKVEMYFPWTSKAPTQKIREPAELSGSRALGKRILLVEDNDGVRSATSERLKILGADVTEAVDGVDALHLIDASVEFDLVLTDIVMPRGITGYDVCKKIRAEQPSSRLLLTTGFDERMARAQQNDFEGVSILRKPYSMTDLKRALDDVFKDAPKNDTCGELDDRALHGVNRCS